MIGAAALIQGYVALCGFGITLIRNQIVDEIPNAINIILLIVGLPVILFNLEKNSFSFAFITLIFKKTGPFYG